MRAAATLAVLVLAATAAAAGAHGAARVACPPSVASHVDPRHSYELDVIGAYGRVTDTHGRLFDVPGVNENTTLSDPPMFGDLQQLVIDEQANDSYVVVLKGTNEFPAQFTLSRDRAQGPSDEYLADDVASWFVPHSLKGATISLAFATGQPVASVRLCVNGQAIIPTSTVSGPKAKDQDAPRVYPKVVPEGTGQVRITLRATDTVSGVAGMWTVVNAGRSRRLVPYSGPFVVRRGPQVIVWAVDRAGNMTTPAIATR